MRKGGEEAQNFEASVLPASTAAAGEMDNFQLSISLSEKLSERQMEE